MPDRRESASDKRRLAKELVDWSLERPAEEQVSEDTTADEASAARPDDAVKDSAER